MDGYYDLATNLGTVDPPLFIFGGIAEDILFPGRLTRPHSDIDVLIYRDEVPMRLNQFAALGFPPVEVYYQPQRDIPLVLHTMRDGMHVELGVFERENERTSFVVDDVRRRLHRVFLPDGSFGFTPIATENAQVRIVSPRCLYQFRAAFQTLGIFGEPRPTDRAAQITLRTRFLADVPAADLIPEIVPLEIAGAAHGA